MWGSSHLQDGVVLARERPPVHCVVQALSQVALRGADFGAVAVGNVHLPAKRFHPPAVAQSLKAPDTSGVLGERNNK